MGFRKHLKNAWDGLRDVRAEYRRGGLTRLWKELRNVWDERRQRREMADEIIDQLRGPAWEESGRGRGTEAGLLGGGVDVQDDAEDEVEAAFGSRLGEYLAEPGVGSLDHVVGIALMRQAGLAEPGPGEPWPVEVSVDARAFTVAFGTDPYDLEAEHERILRFRAKQLAGAEPARAKRPERGQDEAIADDELAAVCGTQLGDRLECFGAQSLERVVGIALMMQAGLRSAGSDAPWPAAVLVDSDAFTVVLEDKRILRFGAQLLGAEASV